MQGTPIQEAVSVDGDISHRVKYSSGWTPWQNVAKKSDFTIKQAQFALNEGIESYYNNNLSKSGRIVCFKLQTNTANVKDAEVVATIPAEFYPLNTAMGIADVNGTTIIYNISTEGKLIMYTHNRELTGSIRVAGSYISA